MDKLQYANRFSLEGGVKVTVTSYNFSALYIHYLSRSSNAPIMWKNQGTSLDFTDSGAAVSCSGYRSAPRRLRLGAPTTHCHTAPANT